MKRQHIPSPNRLFKMYQTGTITRPQWLEGMRRHFLLALSEINEDRSDPQRALLETWRCKNAARRLKKENTESELREIFMSLSELDDFPPATYLWNADQLDIPLYCFFREKRVPVLRFKKIQIRRLTAELTIEYGGIKSKSRICETISMRRDWRGTMVVESRENT